MKVAILSANLGNFDTPIDPIKQDLPDGVEEIVFHRFTDEDFPPIADLPPRFQYRIPKLFGWQMFPGYDVYIWMDGGMSLQRPDCVKWLLEQLGDADILLFRHPWRGTIKDEVEHIEIKLQEGNRYITPRYKNGLHKEQLDAISKDPGFKDNVLYASTAFVYRNNEEVRKALGSWWFYQSRYFTCDQVALPYVVYLHGLKVNVVKDSLFKIGHLSLVSHHK